MEGRKLCLVAAGRKASLSHGHWWHGRIQWELSFVLILDHSEHDSDDHWLFQKTRCTPHRQAAYRQRRLCCGVPHCICQGFGCLRSSTRRVWVMGIVMGSLWGSRGLQELKRSGGGAATGPNPRQRTFALLPVTRYW